MWELKDKRIVLRDANAQIYPDAHAIFCYISSTLNELPDGYPEESPVDTLPIKFSTIGRALHLAFEIGSENNLSFVAYVEHREKKIYVDLTIDIKTDSCVVDDEWFFLTNDCDAIDLLLKKSNVTKTGEISLNQYMKLLHFSSELSIEIEDATSNGLIVEAASKSNIDANVNATLRPYQLQGFRWLDFMTEQGMGCILADEMGLGKTLQIIALLERRKRLIGGTSLIIAPLSLLENWYREIAKFAPSLNVHIHYGAQRPGFISALQGYDAVIIAYSTVSVDLGMLASMEWDLIILDEAHSIKNPNSKRTRAVKSLRKHSGIAVSGTPFESHIDNLWSIVDFALPGYLGTLDNFRANYADDIDGANGVEPLITPVTLRRTAKEVKLELPQRIDSRQILSMSPEEAQEYERARLSIIEELGSGKATLATLQKLRMFCVHPYLIYDAINFDPYSASSKYAHVCDLIRSIAASGEKAILVTTYLEMFSILKRDVPSRIGIPIYAINGSIAAADRQKVIDAFSEHIGPALLVLNPATGGTGLNITAANHVIHYNLDWNPASEDQASARAHRYGQDKTVFTYELIYADTVEEHILEILDKKREMAKAAVVGIDGSRVNSEEIVKALSRTPLKKE